METNRAAEVLQAVLDDRRFTYFLHPEAPGRVPVRVRLAEPGEVSIEHRLRSWRRPSLMEFQNVALIVLLAGVGTVLCAVEMLGVALLRPWAFRIGIPVYRLHYPKAPALVAREGQTPTGKFQGEGSNRVLVRAKWSLLELLTGGNPLILRADLTVHPANVTAAIRISLGFCILVGSLLVGHFLLRSPTAKSALLVSIVALRLAVDFYRLTKSCAECVAAMQGSARPDVRP